MNKRIITGVSLGVVAIPLIYLNALIFSAVVIIATFIACFELIDIARKKVRIQPYYLLFMIIGLLTIELQMFTKLNYISAIFVGILLLLFSTLLFDKKINVISISYVTFILIYILPAAYALIYIRNMSPNYITFIALATFLSDTGAYFSGKYFGKRKLAPTISPNKTIEGSIGGLILGTGCAAIFVGVMYLFPQLRLGFEPSIYLIVVALFAAIGSQFGDLFASQIKRYFGVKDFGNIFPGHGGILDRMDGFIFASLFFFMLILLTR